MLSFFRDFKWYRIKIDLTKILGRCYYFLQAFIWWIIDIIVFIILGIQWNSLIVAIPLGIITFFTTLNWIRTLVYVALYKSTVKHIDDLLERATALEGIPGSGKSSTMNNFSYIISQKQWKLLQYEYWLIMNLPFESLPKKLKERYNEVIKAYRFYLKYIDSHIPCLHSFYTMWDNQGRRSHDLTKDHLSQKKPLPYRSVWVGDEISSMFPNKPNKEEKLDFEKTKQQCRWIRHFTESYGLFADIRFGDAFLGIRSVCGSILNLTKKQKWVLKPLFLLSIKYSYLAFLQIEFWFYTMFKSGSKSKYKIEYKLRKSSKTTGKFLSWLDRLINNVGYRKYFYIRTGCRDNGSDSSQVEEKSGCYYLRSCLDVRYNDRVFKNLYDCLNDDFEEPSFENEWYLSREELQKRTGIY